MLRSSNRPAHRQPGQGAWLTLGFAVVLLFASYLLAQTTPPEASTPTPATTSTPAPAMTEQLRSFEDLMKEIGDELTDLGEDAPARLPLLPPVEKTLLDRVDEFFGKYLVTPLATVLFFDFGTQRFFGTSIPLVVLWLFVGAVFFTLRMNFINVRAFGHAIKVTLGYYDDPNRVGEVTHFQALSSALSATVGLGNIAGVAIAIGKGGPGATFWLIMAGLLGMSSKFTECSLGMLYRKVAPDGTISGGPMHYLKDGLNDLGLWPLGVVLSPLFALLCIGGSFGGGNAFQVVQSMGAVTYQFPWLEDYRYLYGLVMAFAVGVVILGGIRRIAATAEKIVPFMCGLYVLACLYVIGLHLGEMPRVVGLILQGAFTPDAIYGGALGVMVTGIQRAAFSNEAGVGSASIAHSAAKTDEPISEGIVALLEPFIDTVLVCTMTALVIIVTGVYDRSNPLYAEMISSNAGAKLTAIAFQTVVWWFPYVLSATVILFAYSTMISWSYYGERCWSHLFGTGTAMVYRILFLVFTFLGSIVTATNILDFSDLMILSMSIPNIFGAVLLSGKVKRELDIYWAKVQNGTLHQPKDAKDV